MWVIIVMIELVKNRLNNMGYKVTENDNFILKFLIEKVETIIKNNCNIPTIPTELEPLTIDMVMGYFLKEKKSTAIDTLLGLDLTQAVQSIREGDTSITFAIGNGNDTPEQRLNSLINHLINDSEKVLVSYRCLKW